MSLLGTYRPSQPDSGMSAVGGRAEVVIASPDFRVCEGFRMTAHRDDSACPGAVVRKPPVKERA